jgi:hypothetical protein
MCVLSHGWINRQFGCITCNSTISHCWICFCLWSHTVIIVAHRLTFIIICFASLHAIPFVIFYAVVPNLGCISLNPTFTKYVSFVQFCIFIGLLPMAISSTFAVLAYLNVRRIIRRQVPIIRRRLDRQLTAMVLIRVCLFINFWILFK